MIGSIIHGLDCENCGNVLSYDPTATFLAYEDFINLSVYEVSTAIDDMLEKFVVYGCPSCGQKYRYCFKDIEKRLRMSIMQKVLTGVARGEIQAGSAHGTGALFYCGKCTGYDGQGSCPRKVLDKCEIKRLPYVF